MGKRFSCVRSFSQAVLKGYDLVISVVMELIPDTSKEFIEGFYKEDYPQIASLQIMV
jgi:hypothetical protein